MPVSGGVSTTETLLNSGLDADDTATITNEQSMGSGTLVGLYVKTATGVSSTYRITLQISPDGTNWFDTTHTITGQGQLHDITCLASSVRAKVSTAAGSATTIDVFILTR